jgi:hypothetical protein
MARIPSQFDLSGPANLRSGRAIASYDTSAIARGVQSLGAAVTSIGADIRQERTATEGIAADGNASKELNDFVRGFDEDGDYGTFGKRAEQGLSDIRARNAAKISDPDARKRWEAEFSQRAETARNKIADLGERKVREGKLVEAKSGLEGYQSVIANPDATDEDRARARTDAEASIGYMQENGLLDPSEADNWRETIIKGGQFVYGQREIEKDPSIITGKLPAKVSDRAGMAMSFFQKQGWSKEQAAGIVGNLLAESSLNTGARNAGDGSDGSDSIGVAQWNSDRANSLKQFARESGKDWRDFDTQLAFIHEELNSSERGAGDALRNAKDVQQATEAMIMYERPAGSDKGARNAHNYTGRLKYAQQAAGETIRPDWYAAQTPDKQLQLERMADAQQRQHEAAAVAQQKASASIAVDDYQLRIATSDPTLTQNQIMDDVRIDNGQKATLINSFNKEQETNVGVSAIVGAIAAGKDIPINSFDTEESKVAEKAYKQFVGAVPQEQQSAASTSFIRSTGFIPKSMEADIRAGSVSTSADQVATTMQTATLLSRVAPNGFAAMTGADSIRKQMDLFRSYTETMGLNPTQAAEKIIATNDPEQIRRRDAILKSEPIKKLLKDVNANDVASIFDKGIFYRAPAVGGEAPLDAIKVGVNPESEAAIVADYRSTLEEALVDANGDQAAAEDIAKRRFQSVYGTTEFSPLSSNVIVRHPPEKAYPAGAEGTHAYVREQLVEAMKAEGIEADALYLQGDTATEQDIRSGKPARYQVFYEKDGKLERFNLPFYADPMAGKETFKQQRDTRVKEAEQQMLQNREDQTFRYEQLSPEDQRERSMDDFLDGPIQIPVGR